MNFNFNPKVVASALVAALVGGASGLVLALQTSPDSGRALTVALISGFLTGAATGLAGWLKSEGDWAPKP